MPRQAKQAFAMRLARCRSNAALKNRDGQNLNAQRSERLHELRIALQVVIPRREVLRVGRNSRATRHVIIAGGQKCRYPNVRVEQNPHYALCLRSERVSSNAAATSSSISDSDTPLVRARIRSACASHQELNAVKSNTVRSTSAGPLRKSPLATFGPSSLDLRLPARKHAQSARSWARLHASQRSIGDYYEKICPTVSIVILNQSLLPTERIHSTFRVLEVHEYYDLTGALELHFVELPKLERGQGSEPLERWMRFLLAKNEKELEELAMNDPEIQRAKEALTALSRDPEAQELARQREMVQINLKIIRQFEREEGEAKGRAEGEAQGRAEGEAQGRAEGRVESLRLAVATACELLGLEIDIARQELLERLDVDGLTALLNELRRERRWPGER